MHQTEALRVFVFAWGRGKIVSKMLFPHTSTENPCIPPCNSNITASCFFHLDVIHSLFHFCSFSRGIDVTVIFQSQRTSSLTPCFLSFPLTSQLSLPQAQQFFRPKRTPQYTRCWNHIMCHNPPALWWSTKAPALTPTATPNSWFHSYTAEPATSCLKHPSPQTRTKQGSTWFSRSWVFQLWHSNLGAVRQALRLV